MEAADRRREIAAALMEDGGPVPAGALAARFGVSRQVIVGDVALLRASGVEITATPRGYVAGGERGKRYTLACIHDGEGMERELNIMVDNGCTVLDVVIEHAVYGQLTGELHLKNRHDVAEFVRRVREEGAAPLSKLTGGIHLHNLLCPDEGSLRRCEAELREAGILLE